MIKKGFTLVELLVVISIIGILLSLSVFSLQNARESSRDARRKADLEQIKSGLEIYRSDCNTYPTTALSGSLIGSGTPTSCATTNTYISKIPTDPLSPTKKYAYSSNGTTYTICASLEKPPSPSMDVTGCGSCTTTCNYKIINP